MTNVRVYTRPKRGQYLGRMGMWLEAGTLALFVRIEGLSYVCGGTDRLAHIAWKFRLRVIYKHSYSSTRICIFLQRTKLRRNTQDPKADYTSKIWDCELEVETKLLRVFLEDILK